MKTDVGVRVRTSAEIDANCPIDYEVVDKQASFSLADGAVTFYFTDEHAFRRFMKEAMKVLSVVGLGDSSEAVRVSG